MKKIYIGNITKMLQKIQIHYNLLKNIDIFGKIDKIIISINIIKGQKGRIIMKNQSGRTPLKTLLTITILLIIAGVTIAMIFGGTDIGSDIRAFLQKDNATEEKIIDETNKDESIQTEENKE